MMNNNNFSEKMERCQQYIDALEQERTKIQVFSRELPLCLELVTQAIESHKQQLSGTTTEYNLNAQSTECSDDEHTSSDVPVLEEFIPLKSTFSHEDEDEDDGASCASSDLFELDNLSAIGIDSNRYLEELPVYETTHLDTNRAIANGLIL
uniref:Putative ovule protein n=1 Tax=Solanum chacoense TaxID=4108 RepID=A0A0V0GZD8_SOLCH